ncbi:hypothetical protein EDB85DRAFT_2141289 [Lactarius pseudohatsudake]|nr:hypothetical protein EDB85DRAFT_2141289 [Lactarius pseudohatsudake]
MGSPSDGQLRRGLETQRGDVDSGRLKLANDYRTGKEIDSDDDYSRVRPTGGGSGVGKSDEGETSRVEGEGTDACEWSGDGDNTRGDGSSFEAGISNTDADSTRLSVADTTGEGQARYVGRELGAIVEKPPVVPQHVFLAEHSASGRVLDITAQLLPYDLVARLRCGIAEDVDEGLSNQGPAARTMSVKGFAKLTDRGFNIADDYVDSLRVRQRAVVR